jgi:hypothetical protein
VPDTTATVVLSLVHTPPATPSLKFVVAPAQAIGDPAIEDGTGFTVTVVIAEHPVPVIV